MVVGNEVTRPEPEDEAGDVGPETVPAEDPPDADSDGGDLPAPVEAIIEELPEAQREKVRSQVTAMMQFQGAVPHPVFSKITPEHIGKLIEFTENENERYAVDRRETRGHTRFLFVSVLITFLLASGLMVWAGQPGLLEQLVQWAIIAAGGAGFGVGFLKRGGD